VINVANLDVENVGKTMVHPEHASQCASPYVTGPIANFHPGYGGLMGNS